MGPARKYGEHDILDQTSNDLRILTCIGNQDAFQERRGHLGNREHPLMLEVQRGTTTEFDEGLQSLHRFETQHSFEGMKQQKMDSGIASCVWSNIMTCVPWG